MIRRQNRILNFVVLFTIILSGFLVFQKKVSADIGPPFVFPFDVIVTNPNGAEIKKPNGEIEIAPKGTRLKVSYESIDQSGETIMVLEAKGYSEVKASDVVYAEEAFDMSSLSKNTPISKYVITDGVYLYKGPGERYGKNDDDYQLPAGIMINSVYYDDIWMYIEYEGHSGWVNYYNTFKNGAMIANVAVDEWSRSVIVTREKIELRDTPYEDGEVIAVIDVEPLSEIPVTYYFNTGKYSSEIYINYGEYSGWLSKDSTSYDVAFKSDNKKGIAIKELRVFDSVDLNTEVGRIPINTEFQILYSSGGWSDKEARYYIRIMDSGVEVKEGWIDEGGFAKTTYWNGEYQKKTFDYEQQLYDEVDGKPIGEVEAGEYYVLYYYILNGEKDENSDNQKETWYYLSKRTMNSPYEKIGWIKSLSDDEIKELEEARKKELEELMTNEEPEATYYLSNDDYVAITDEQMIETMIWLLIGFGLISVIIVILLIIAKKRRKNNDDPDKLGEETNKDSEDSDDKVESKDEKETRDKTELKDEGETKDGVELKEEEVREEAEVGYDESKNETGDDVKDEKTVDDKKGDEDVE